MSRANMLIDQTLSQDHVFTFYIYIFDHLLTRNNFKFKTFCEPGSNDLMAPEYLYKNTSAMTETILNFKGFNQLSQR